MARIAVALSGGVDSTVAALMLRRAGHEVIGLTLALGAGPRRALTEAAEAARALGLTHQVIDVAAAFERAVIAPAARAYAAGRTPNPCAVCNAALKIPALWRAAQAFGCQALATGHYARLARLGGRPVLARAADAAKSQAYFLARLRPALLERLIFPLGGLTKDEVRRVARESGLAAAQRAESQDGCFLPPGAWDELIGRRGLTRPGPIEDAAGRVIGQHGGLHRFTVGQRRGLGLALGRPTYVLSLDGARAAVRVGPKEALVTGGFWGGAAMWSATPGADAIYDCRVRYAAQGAACRVERQGDLWRVDFNSPQGAVAPGQLAVFFLGDRVAGSAWIIERF